MNTTFAPLGLQAGFVDTWCWEIALEALRAALVCGGVWLVGTSGTDCAIGRCAHVTRMKMDRRVLFWFTRFSTPCVTVTWVHREDVLRRLEGRHFECWMGYRILVWMECGWWEVLLRIQMAPRSSDEAGVVASLPSQTPEREVRR
jgi:hypothetical protein